MVIETNSKEVKNIFNLYNSGNLNDAEFKAKKMIQEHRDSSVLLNVLGVIFNSKKKFDEAIKNFKKALDINPNYAQAENNLGVMYQRINKYEESIFCYKNAIKLNQRKVKP